MRTRLACLLTLSMALQIFAATAARAETEEQRLVRIAQTLKPISDSQWNEIAGPKISDNYEVQKSDTLWDISKRLFGNPFYWPKVWTFNAKITNPHVISPGQTIGFTPGSSAGPPEVNTNGGSHQAVADSGMKGNTTVAQTGSHEFDKLPPHQWAPMEITMKIQQYDELGIDKEMRIRPPSRVNFRLRALATDEELPEVAEVTASRREGVGLTTGETVFLDSPDHELQVGNTYSVMNTPERIKEPRSDRSGYLYTNSGEIKILGIRDDLYIGVITRAFDAIERGNMTYALLPAITSLTPVAASAAVESLVITSRLNNGRYSSQFQFVHFDRGAEDGVQVGNVFRIYEYTDPLTNKKITESDYLVKADVLVVHVSAGFSTGLVLRARDIITRSDFAVLLTDVSDVERRMKSGEVGASGDSELDELDMLDRTSGEGMGPGEKQEIEQLDQWDRTREATPPGEETMPPEGDLAQPPSSEPPPATDEQMPPMDEQLTPEAPPAEELPPGSEATPPPADTPPPPAEGEMPSLESSPLMPSAPGAAPGAAPPAETAPPAAGSDPLLDPPTD